MHTARPNTLHKQTGETNTHQPLLTLSDRTWLLKPSSAMLMISFSVVISRPSRHSWPNREMEGTENVWKGEKRIFQRWQEEEMQCFFLYSSAFPPLARLWGIERRSQTDNPCWLDLGNRLQIRRTRSQRTVCLRRAPSWNTEWNISLSFLSLQISHSIVRTTSVTFVNMLCFKASHLPPDTRQDLVSSFSETASWFSSITSHSPWKSGSE